MSMFPVSEETQNKGTVAELKPEVRRTLTFNSNFGHDAWAGGSRICGSDVLGGKWLVCQTGLGFKERLQQRAADRRVEVQECRERRVDVFHRVHATISANKHEGCDLQASRVQTRSCQGSS